MLGVRAGYTAGVRRARHIIACAALTAALAAVSDVAFAAPRTFELAVVSEDGAGVSPWVFDVPLPAGWKVLKDDESVLAAIVRRYSKGCELFVNVYTEPRPGAVFPLRRVLQHASRVERADRLVVSDGRRFPGRSWVGRIGGLAFGGGATGPGGFATLHLMPEPRDGAAPRITLTAQGGTDGACFNVDTTRAPKLVVDAVRPIVTASVLRYAG